MDEIDGHIFKDIYTTGVGCLRIAIIPNNLSYIVLLRVATIDAWLTVRDTRLLKYILLISHILILLLN
jgi:hypothetical protein